MDCPLPCSTLAVAVGWWQCRQSQNAETKNGSNPDLPVTCRLFAPPSLIDTAANELLGYAPRFLEASCELLGPYPFKRLDMLVLPKCFACMGLKRLAYRSKCQFSSLISIHWFEWWLWEFGSKSVMITYFTFAFCGVTSLEYQLSLRAGVSHCSGV